MSSRWHLTILLLILWVPAGWGQLFPSEMFHLGRVVTVERDTLYGSLRYNLEKNVVQLYPGRDTSRILTFGSGRVLAFEFYQADIGKRRTFYALPYTNRQKFETVILLEVLAEGELTLFCREFVATRSRNGAGTNRSLNTFESLDYFYYVLPQGGEITRLRNSRRDVLRYMESEKELINSYFDRHELSFFNPNDVASVFQYYNRLRSKERN